VNWRQTGPPGWLARASWVGWSAGQVGRVASNVNFSACEVTTLWRYINQFIIIIIIIIIINMLKEGLNGGESPGTLRALRGLNYLQPPPFPRIPNYATAHGAGLF